MKLFAVALVALSSSMAMAGTEQRSVELCGRVHIESSRGLAAVMTYSLEVPAGPMLPAFSTYELQASGTDMALIEEASKIISSLRDGDQVCLEGLASQDKDYYDILVPTARTR